jgi:hypothetical protein
MEWEWPKVRALQVKRLFHHYPWMPWVKP